MRRVKSLLIISIIFTVLLLVYNMNHQLVDDSINYSNYYAQVNDFFFLIKLNFFN